MRSAKVLFVGDGWLGSNARSLAAGFREAGAEVLLVDTTMVNHPPRWSAASAMAKVLQRRAPWVIDRIHAEILDAAAAFRPDVLLCFKTIHLDQAILLSVPARWRLHYSPDDVSNPYNTTPAYLGAETEWDAIITTKHHNVPELNARGVRNAWFMLSAYDPAWHHPVARRTVRRFAVGFIGNRRPDREQFLIRVASRFEREALISGPGWSRLRALRRAGAVIEPAQYGEGFSIAVASTQSQLVLLNSDNRDSHTCRSFEVPAACGLAIAQRTGDHEELFEDRREALLFSSVDEAISLIERACSDEKWAASIAQNGHRRITTGHHRYGDRAAQVLSTLGLGS